MSIGPAEILVVAILALVLLGPKRLPDAARQMGKAYHEVQKFGDEFKAAIAESSREASNAVDLRDHVIEPQATDPSAIPMMPPAEEK